MEMSDCSMYNGNLQGIQTGFNGTYEPTDSIIVRTKEIQQPFEVVGKGESHNDEINDNTWSDDSGYELNQSHNDHFSEEKDTLAEDDGMVENVKGKQPILMTVGEYHPGIQSDFEVKTGVTTENSNSILSDPSTSSSSDQTEAADLIIDSGRPVEQTFFESEESNPLINTSISGNSDQNGEFDSVYEVQRETACKAKDSERSSRMKIDLFKSKGRVTDSGYIYRNETGEPSLVSPCTTALAEHQDLDPTRYGPNGNLDNRCELCGKTFSQPYLLKVHFRIHSGFKPYKCELCSKGFAQSSGLRSHKLTHTGEKPYKCDICDKTFTASGSLNMHYRTHNGERPFSCEVCGRTFRYRSAMNKHIMIHTGDRPYTCDDCGKDFSRKGNLETHRRIHTNSMPYQCDICKKKFNQMSNLRTHEVTHTLVKPYKCDLCGSEFFTKFNMQRHIVIQHIKKKR
ncbi:zinc finger protein 271-like [Mizuhopecten yessoensis]|uniref:zinc finger protein 271-like n=1 Tax=Mizuhopecten yessoensis TaxID=6573 RepID=UPI000B45C236|nr:zinc finger protein 271-like [Mizuhopecten yessoensis]